MKNNDNEKLNISNSLDELYDLENKDETKKEKKKSNFSLKFVTLDKKKKPKKKEILLIVIPTFLVATAVIIYLFISQVANTYKMDETFVQYYYEGTYEISKGSSLIKDSDDKIILNSDGMTNEVSSLVLYGKNSNLIVFPQNMIYYDGQGIDYYLVPCFTELSWSNNVQTLSLESRSVTVTGGFMFDGADYYLFLEPVTITYNGYKKELSTYSYVEVTDGYDIVGYNYETGESFSATADSDVIVTSGGGFTISLRSDSLETHNGNKLLLFCRPELLDKIWERG